MDLPCVLVVEDSRSQRAVLVHQLQQTGYRVLEAESGAQAQACMDVGGIDAVLLDWELPDINGPELLIRWQAHDVLRWVPVLMITSHTEPERIRYALDVGALDFLRKPPGNVELDARLRSALRVRRLHLELLQLATRDPLTGLFNRRALLERMQTEIERSSRYRRPLTVGLVDIDHFKRVNDVHGHDVGDVVIKQMAAVLLAGTRSVDTVARYGGEEFVVVMPETPLGGARLCFERLRERARGTEWGLPGVRLEVTFSCGIASAPSAATKPSALLKGADEALYRAKHNGRDRTELQLDLDSAEQRK